MNILELIGGILLLITVVLATVLCMMQDQNQDQNMTSAITGASNDSFYEGSHPFQIHLGSAHHLLCSHTAGEHSSGVYQVLRQHRIKAVQ